MLVDHYTKGTRLSGTDKASEGAYSGKNIRHFHLSEPDTLLTYQITRNVLVLLAISTHAECFGENETAFLASIADDLIERRSMRDVINIVEISESDQHDEPSPIINLKNWLSICETERALIVTETVHTGDLGDLETALNAWVSGSMRQAQSQLLALSTVADRFSTVNKSFLFRGFIPTAKQWSDYQTGQFVIETPQTEPLASWSFSRKSVVDFMYGWDRPWVVIHKPSSELDIFINLTEFDRVAKPFTAMSVQKEIIVRMPPMLHVTKAEAKRYAR